jgi:hypothetical protein
MYEEAMWHRDEVLAMNPGLSPTFHNLHVALQPDSLLQHNNNATAYIHWQMQAGNRRNGRTRNTIYYEIHSPVLIL